MSAPDNPYQASDAALPAPDLKRPPALRLAVVGYLSVYVLQAIAILHSDLPYRVPLTAAVVAKGVFALAIGAALWWRQSWARVWVVFATVFAVFGLVLLLRPGEWAFLGLAVVSHLLRIAVAGMMFLPSVRRWFASRGAAG